MDLSYSDEQLMLRESVGRYLDGLGAGRALRRLRDTGDMRGFVAQSWTQMVEQGWPGVASSCDHGGSELGQVGLGLIMEAVGRTLCPSPLEATVGMAIPWLERAAASEDHLAVLQSAIAGERLLTLAVQEGPHFDPAVIAARADLRADQVTLNGRKTNVPDAGIAQQIIVVARAQNGLRAFLLDADTPGLTVARMTSMDSRVVGEVVLEDVVVPASAMIGDDAGPILSFMEDVVAAQTAAQLLGIALEVFARTCDYLKSREQFGVKIGSFQALQHRAAILFVELETSRALVQAALTAIDTRSPDASTLASAAKAKLCRVSRLAVNEAIQMHGGIGVTDELDLGLYLKRAMALSHLFGDMHYHADRFAVLKSF